MFHTCGVNLEDLLGYAAGRLDDERNERVHSHLAGGCPECMRKLDVVT